MKSAYPIFATTILPELARFVPSSWSQHPSRISILFAFQSKLLHAHTWKHAAKEGKGFVYSPGIREFGSIRRIERVFRVSRIVGVRVSVACFYEEYPFEMSREEKRSANGGRGRVSCTLLYYFSGIIYFRLFYLHGPRNRIPGETVSGETRVMMSSAMRVNNVRVLPPSFPFHPFHSLLYLCAINRSCDLPHEVEIEARKFWITRT